MEPKITVIMPSFNVANYIKNCMDSVLGQTLADLEILSVDAGSTDGTLEILKDYEKKDPRITVVLSEKKSYGYQVNKGIALAKGKYIGVVETDDRIFPDMYESLYALAEESGADYVKGVAEAFIENPAGEDTHYDIKAFSQEKYEEAKGKIAVIPREHPELVLSDSYIWTGIYKKEFIKNIRLNETAGAAYQDIGFLIQAQYNAKWAVYLDQVVYCYRRDNANASCYNPKAFHYLVEEYAYVDQLMHGKEAEWISAYHYKMFRQTDIRFRTMAESRHFWEDALPDIYVLTRKIRRAFEDGILKKTDLTDTEWKAAERLLESPYAIYEAYVKPVVSKFHMLEEIGKQLKGKDIIIFGCGKWGKFFHNLSASKGYGKVLAYCDNQSGDGFVQGLTVMKPEAAVTRYPKAVYVIANKTHADEMKAQLGLLGIREDHILVYNVGTDLFLLGKSI